MIARTFKFAWTNVINKDGLTRHQMTNETLYKEDQLLWHSVYCSFDTIYIHIYIYIHR